MIPNPSKFQAIAIGNKEKCRNELEIDKEFKVKIEKNFVLLVIEIDEDIKFDSHIYKICKNVAK